MPYITPTQDTLLKLQPLPSQSLPPDAIRHRKAGDKLGIINVRKAENQHWEIRLSGKLTIGQTQTDRCFIFSGHWQGVTDVFNAAQAQERSTITQSLKPAPEGVFKTLRRDSSGAVVAVCLNVPYASQTDNRNNPSGSCNVTSMSMALRFFGIEQKRSGIQFEDELYEFMETSDLSRHSPQDLKIMVEKYGLIDRFSSNASKEEIKKWIVSGRPVVVHGYFTAFGHITVIVGFDERGWILHDPWGEYPYGSLKNDSSNPQRGAYITYSYGLMGNCCWSDGGCWTHFLDRAGYSAPVATPSPNPIATAPKIPDGCSLVKTTQATTLKAKPVQSAQLGPSEKYAIGAGAEIIGVVSKAEGGHLLITKPGAETIGGRNTWYLFAKHAEVITPGGVSPTTPGALLTKGDIEEVARSIGVEARALRAVIAVEAAGSGFLPSGRPKILFESHLFSEDSDSRFDDSHPNLSTYDWTPSNYAGGEGEWDRLEAAMKLDRVAALRSASWGLPQVLGRNSDSLGYKSIDEFVMCMKRSEKDQLDAMARFVRVNGLIEPLQKRRWGAFARIYNGPEYALNAYDEKLAQAYADLA